MAIVAQATDWLYRKMGSHVQMAELYRRQWAAAKGDHLDAARLDGLVGIDTDVLKHCIAVATDGVVVKETASRWPLRQHMDVTTARECGNEGLRKVAEDGKAGRVLCFSSAVLDVMNEDPVTVMVSKMIAVVKKFLDGRVDPDNRRFCHAVLEPNKIGPADGVGPGGGVSLPTHLTLMMLIITIFRRYPGVEM